MKRNYISNSSDSIRMFSNNILEFLSKVHFSVPLFIYLPVISYFSFKAFNNGISVLIFSCWLFAGIAVWTITEYFLHRYIFHFEPTSKWGRRLHFIFHGVHHDYPKDARRLVMPPSASVPLAAGFFFLFNTFFTIKMYLFAFFPGFLTGYLLYDMMHYAMHHYNFKSEFMKKVKKHHMLHHYNDSTKGYGVSTALWDVILRSDFPKKQTHEPSHQG